MKHSIKKITSLLLAACFLFGTIGCALMPQLKATVVGSGYGSEIRFTDDSMLSRLLSEKETLSDEEIMEMFWELEDALFSAVSAKDYEAFKALYYDTDESVIRSDFEYDWSCKTEKDKRDGFVICGENGYYAIADAYYIVSGRYPDFNRSSTDGYMFVHYADGKLQYAYGQEANDTLVPVFTAKLMEFFNRVSPGFEDEVNVAVNAGNFTNKNYMFLNSDFSYSGSNDVSLIYMWQTENGDVKAAVWHANGTDMNISSKTKITVTDDSLGTICDVWVGTITTRAHHNQVKVFTIPASSVRTGTQVWTSMHSHVNTKNTP